MSENLPLDNHIKEQLGNYSPDVPPHIWDQIVAKRGRQRPKGFWLLAGRNWLLMAALLLAVGGTAYWLSRSTAPTPAAPLAGQTATTPQTSAPNATSSNTSNSASPTSQANPTLPSNSNSTTATQDAPAIADANNNAATNPTNNKDITGTTGADNLGNQPIVDATTTATDKAQQSKGAKTIANGLQFAPSPNNRFVNRPAKPLRLPIRKAITGATADNDDGQNDKVTSDNPAANNQGAAQNNLLGTATANLPKLDGAAMGIYGTQAPMGQLRNKLLRNLTLPDCPSIEDNAAGNKKYLEIYGGPDFGMRSFGSFNSDSSSINYLQRRKESARFASAFSVGIRYTKVFNNGMSLRSGINYSQINEKFQYINERDIRYILVITPRQITSGGNIITVFDTLRYTETGKRIKTTYNRYRSIDIPLQLGYEFGNGRLHTNISAGAIINLYSWHKGDVLDSAYQPVSITTGKGSSAYSFKTNIGVGFLGSVSVYYKLNSRLHVLAEPYFRYNLQPMTRDNQNITQKYSTLGLRLGLRWDFK